MIKPTFYLVLFSTFFSFGLNAQTLIEKVVYSLEEEIPLENVHVITSDTVVFTGSNGTFKLFFNEGVEFFHLGYESVLFNELGEIPDTIRLNRKNNRLEEITINSQRLVKRITKEPKYWIKNFELAYDHLVTFKNPYLGGKEKLVLYDLEGNYVSDYEFRFKIQDIVTSCIGQLFIKYRYGFQMIYVSNGEIVEGPKYPKRKYEQVFEDCVLFYNGNWIYEFERFNGLERNIVNINEGKDSLLKKIILPQLIILKERYKGIVAYGAEAGTITTNDPSENARIRDAQETSDFLDKVVFRASEENSFAVLGNGILIANSMLDSLHYISTEVVERENEIQKRDKVFNDVDQKKAYFFNQKNRKKYVLSEINKDLDFQKVLTINESILKIRIVGNKVFYLIRDDSRKSIKLKLYYENI